MWAKRIVQSLLRRDDAEALRLASEKDADYEETKRRLAKVEARLQALMGEAEVPQRRGEQGNARLRPR